MVAEPSQRLLAVDVGLQCLSVASSCILSVHEHAISMAIEKEEGIFWGVVLSCYSPASSPGPRRPVPVATETQPQRLQAAGTLLSRSAPRLPGTRRWAASESAVPPPTPARPRSTWPPGTAGLHCGKGAGTTGGRVWLGGAVRWRGEEKRT